MTQQPIQVFLFVSIKGGVGKSTLSTLTALALSACGRRPLVLDADFTGSSLGDGLSLCAPSETGFLSREETLRLRGERVDARPAPKVLRPPYLNDAILHRAQRSEDDYRIDQGTWRHNDHPDIRWFPSSPAPYDVSVAVRWLHHHDQALWGKRFTTILSLSAEQLPDLTDVVIDLPPGLFGFSETILRASRDLDRARWAVRPILVTTPDRNDLFPAMESFRLLRSQLPQAVPLINKSSEGLRVIRQDLKSFFVKRIGHARLEDLLVELDWAPRTLGRIFREPHLHVPSTLLDKLAQALTISP